MVKKILILLVVTLVALADQTTYPSFGQYVVQFEKSYNDEQYAFRKTVYEERIANFSSIIEYTPGVNNMTDWTQQEIRSLSHTRSHPHPASTTSRSSISSRRVGAPSSLNWKYQQVITSIKNQGSCGSCWAFAMAAYAQSKLIIAGQKNRNNIDLSQQYLLECTYGSTCNGGYFEYSIQQAKKMPEEHQYPYSPYYSYSNICSTEGIQIGYDDFNEYDLSDSQLIDLLQTGPIPVSISSEGWENYGSGVFICPSTASIDHGVLLVGYTSDYWIIKNSWGSSWGESGYMKITRNRANRANCIMGYSAHYLWEYKMCNLILVALLAILILFG